ncbi:hypothetical protein OSTOST_08804, partial [Ostertagia ostertagi]
MNLEASRHDGWPSLGTHAMVHWKHTNHTAAEAGILEDVSNVYLGGRLCAARQPKNVIEPQDIGSYYYRHCFAGRGASQAQSPCEDDSGDGKSNEMLASCPAF